MIHRKADGAMSQRAVVEAAVICDEGNYADSAHT